MPELIELLGQAQSEPRLIASADGGAHLAIALNCLMAKHGFQPVKPPDDWNTRYSDEWIFEYSRKGCVGQFALHCSLQASSGKMFVQASELNSPGNRSFMGLILGKYIPDELRCRQRSWEGVLSQQDALEQSFAAYIAEPLLKAAAVSEDLDSAVDPPRQSKRQRLSSALRTKKAGAGLALLAALAAAAAARR